MGETDLIDLLASQYPDVNFIIPHLGSFADDWRAHLRVVDQLTRCNKPLDRARSPFCFSGAIADLAVTVGQDWSIAAYDQLDSAAYPNFDRAQGHVQIAEGLEQT